jgi:hypothetical protein
MQQPQSEVANMSTPSSIQPTTCSNASVLGMFSQSAADTGTRCSDTEKAELISRATNQAMTAARSIVLSGGTQSTAFTTAKAAAKSVLLPKYSASDRLPVSPGRRRFLGRRKDKRQAEIIASMALVSVNSSMQQQQQQFPGSECSAADSPPMFFGAPTPMSRGGSTLTMDGDNMPFHMGRHSSMGSLGPYMLPGMSQQNYQAEISAAVMKIANLHQNPPVQEGFLSYNPLNSVPACEDSDEQDTCKTLPKAPSSALREIHVTEGEKSGISLKTSTLSSGRPKQTMDQSLLQYFRKKEARSPRSEKSPKAAADQPRITTSRTDLGDGYVDQDDPIYEASSAVTSPRSPMSERLQRDISGETSYTGSSGSAVEDSVTSSYTEDSCSTRGSNAADDAAKDALIDTEIVQTTPKAVTNTQPAPSMFAIPFFAHLSSVFDCAPPTSNIDPDSNELCPEDIMLNPLLAEEIVSNNKDGEDPDQAQQVGQEISGPNETIATRSIHAEAVASAEAGKEKTCTEEIKPAPKTSDHRELSMEQLVLRALSATLPTPTPSRSMVDSRSDKGTPNLIPPKGAEYPNEATRELPEGEEPLAYTARPNLTVKVSMKDDASLESFMDAEESNKSSKKKGAKKKKRFIARMRGRKSKEQELQWI